MRPFIKDVSAEVCGNTADAVFKPEADTIDNQVVLNVLKSIKEGLTKKYALKLLVHLFKFLKSLRQIDNDPLKPEALKASLFLINSLRSESDFLISFMEKSSVKAQDENFGSVVRSMMFQFSMETKRVFLQELKDISREGRLKQRRGNLENSHGILKNLSEQCIVQIIQFFDPELKGSDVFSDFVTKREQSKELREDVMLLNRFLMLAGSTHTFKEREHVLAALKSFILYFENTTSKLIRYNDYEEFSAYLNRVMTNINKDAASGVSVKILEDVRPFRIFIGTYLKQLSQRAELAYMAVDMEQLENRMQQYLK